MKRTRAGIENDASIIGRHYPPTASGHLLIPDLETSAVFFAPTLIEIDEHVDSAFQAHCRVKIEVGVNVEMAALVHLVEASADEIGVRDQALDTCQVLDETDERNRVERIEE